MTTDLVCAPGKLMSILFVSETFRPRRGGKEWLVIDFSIGQNGLNEKSKDVICMFEEVWRSRSWVAAVVCVDQTKKHITHVFMSWCWGNNDDESLFNECEFITVLQHK